MSEVEPKGKKFRRSAGIIAAFLLLTSISAYGIIRTAPISSGTNATLTCDGSSCNLNVPIKVNLKLQVNVTDHGKLLSSTTLPHDLILNNFYLLLNQILNNAQSAATLSAGLTNTAGGAQTPLVWGSTLNTATCATSNGPFNCVLTGQGGLIEVGTSSTAAARTDSNLGSVFQSYFDTSSICSASTTDSVVITGSTNANTGTTMTEAGLFLQDTLGSATKTFMFAHDVFAGVVVSAGNTITTQYTWSLNNAGFNYNLCELLAAYFTQPNGLSNTVKTPASLMVFFDTAGRNVSWSPLCSYGASYVGAVQPLASATPSSSGCANFASGDTNNAMKINVGTGSSAFTPTTRSLTASVASNFITSVNYDSAGNAYQTANIVIAGGATISEAAIYLTLPKACIGYSPLDSSPSGSCVTAYTSDTIMLLAATFTGQVVPAGQSIGITFQESG